MLTINHSFGEILDQKIKSYNARRRIIDNFMRNPESRTINNISLWGMVAANLVEIATNPPQEFIDIYYQQVNSEVNELMQIGQALRERARVVPNYQNMVNSIVMNLERIPRIRPIPNPVPREANVPPEPLDVRQNAPEGQSSQRLKYTSYALIGAGIFSSSIGSATAYVGKKGAEKAAEEAVKKGSELAAAKMAEEAAKRTVIETANEMSKFTAKQLAKKSAEVAAAELAKKSAEEVLKKATQEAVTKGLELAAAQGAQKTAEKMAEKAVIEGAKYIGAGATSAVVGGALYGVDKYTNNNDTNDRNRPMRNN